MCVLELLNLEYCRVHITDVAGVAISKCPTLKKLNLGWLVSVTDNTVVTLAQSCLDLEILDLRGCWRVTGGGIGAFSGHKCLQTLDLYNCVPGITVSDLEPLLKCRSLKSILVDPRLRLTLSRYSKFLEFI
ncbi:hypothetical protein ACLB2K_017765 [Fragaria x ananassa]